MAEVASAFAKASGGQAVAPLFAKSGVNAAKDPAPISLRSMMRGRLKIKTYSHMPRSILPR